jgi:hypothetical protein
MTESNTKKRKTEQPIEQTMEENIQEQEHPPSKNEVTNILEVLNKTNKDKRWQQTVEKPLSLEKNNPEKGILVILTMDKPDKLSIDCDTFMEGINREMNTNTKDLVNSENRIYIKERGRYLQIEYVDLREKTRISPVSNFVNCSEDKIKQSKTECKLPEVIKELIWECIESKHNFIDNKTMAQLEKYYRPQKEIEKLVPEEKEPPICDFFKELRPKSIPNTTQDVCGDEMTKYLKEKLADMREDINKVTKRETSAFEKSTELAGNEMWEIINKTIQDPSQSQFNPNLFIHANIKMPTSSEVEHKEADNDTNMPPVNNEDTNQMNQSDKKEYNNDDQEEKPAQVQIDITEADKSDNHLVSQDKDIVVLPFVSAPKEETKNTATTLKKSARRVSYLAKKRKTQVSQEI